MKDVRPLDPRKGNVLEGKEKQARKKRCTQLRKEQDTQMGLFPFRMETRQMDCCNPFSQVRELGAFRECAPDPPNARSHYPISASVRVRVLETSLQLKDH